MHSINLLLELGQLCIIHCGCDCGCDCDFDCGLGITFWYILDHCHVMIYYYIECHVLTHYWIEYHISIHYWTKCHVSTNNLFGFGYLERTIVEIALILISWDHYMGELWTLYYFQYAIIYCVLVACLIISCLLE